MTEITFIGPVSQEVYVQIEFGEVVDLYLDPDHPLTEEFNFLPGKNPLFVHAEHPFDVYQVVRERGYVVCGEDLSRMDNLEENYPRLACR